MSEVRIAIGGHVYDSSAAPATAVPEAWVQLEQPDGTPVQSTQTDADGRFQFGYLTAGSYQLQWRATGFPLPAAPRPIEIPSPSGEYDLLL
ncbi:MAG: carboxypeptidase-like regulatory domain-containing protein [Anaerolineae bacterium]